MDGDAVAVSEDLCLQVERLLLTLDAYGTGTSDERDRGGTCAGLGEDGAAVADATKATGVASTARMAVLMAGHQVGGCLFEFLELSRVVDGG